MILATRPSGLFGGLLAMLLMAGQAQADLLEAAETAAPMQRLELASDAELGGRSVLVTGAADPTGQRYHVSKVDVMSPIVVKVLADDIEKPIEVSLHRVIWQSADAAGTTGPDGIFDFTGRIDDEFGIWLRADEPSAYHLLVWIGDPVPVEVPPTFYIDGQPIAAPKEN
ncbi:hypothetical protein LV82_01520 [Albidovulum inexpectatum]|uniref:Uncharacterized protein n=1 Tax=Albidovulum inexpectatum TaxID=196587 RepID=A0A2S5JHE4_9RHOB|nr:hypothetical protein [Albidovulum inexpectatum]PPB80788.1 hypothetical protein LV82_01520 [Albidovulum inexpectatum]